MAFIPCGCCCPMRPKSHAICCTCTPPASCCCCNIGQNSSQRPPAKYLHAESNGPGISNATPFCDTHGWICLTICFFPVGPFIEPFESQWPSWRHWKQCPSGACPPIGLTPAPTGTLSRCCYTMGVPIGVDYCPCRFAQVCSLTTCDMARARGCVVQLASASL